MTKPTMTHLTSQEGVTPVQEFHIVMIPANEAEPVERKGVPLRDAQGNRIATSPQGKADEACRSTDDASR